MQMRQGAIGAYVVGISFRRRRTKNAAAAWAQSLPRRAERLPPPWYTVIYALVILALSTHTSHAENIKDIVSLYVEQALPDGNVFTKYEKPIPYFIMTEDDENHSNVRNIVVSFFRELKIDAKPVGFNLQGSIVGLIAYSNSDILKRHDNVAAFLGQYWGDEYRNSNALEKLQANGGSLLSRRQLYPSALHTMALFPKVRIISYPKEIESPIFYALTGVTAVANPLIPIDRSAKGIRKIDRIFLTAVYDDQINIIYSSPRDKILIKTKMLDLFNSEKN
jgi:hypothetical protein